MPETRIRGQEVTVRISKNKDLLATVTAFKDFTATFRGRVLEEGYLGETTLRYDDISDGISGTFTLHAESQDLFLLVQFIQQRQQRAQPVQTSLINVIARFSFPNGDTPKAFLKDLKFGEIPIAVGERSQYVNAVFPFNCDRAQFITS